MQEDVIKSSEILEERGGQYGSFSKQVASIKVIMNALKDLRNQEGDVSCFIEHEDVEMFFLALKLCRMQTDKDNFDTYQDLVNYTVLVCEKRVGKNPITGEPS